LVTTRCFSSATIDGASLNPHHTHFLLLDNALAGRECWGAEIDLRTAIEDYMADVRRVPMVMLVVQVHFSHEWWVLIWLMGWMDGWLNRWSMLIGRSRNLIAGRPWHVAHRGVDCGQGPSRRSDGRLGRRGGRDPGVHPAD